MLPLLERAHLEYIDLSALPLSQLTDGVSEIAGDGHPSAAAYRVVAAELVRALARE
jgi:hypothetical protein